MSPFSDTQQQSQELAGIGEVILQVVLNITSCFSILKISMIFFNFDYNVKLMLLIFCAHQTGSAQRLNQYISILIIEYYILIAMEPGSQIISQHDEDENQPTQERYVPWTLKLMFGYLYFAQGFILSISGTVPYVYPQLPDYFTLSLFSLATLPFSLKFIIAPALQKYSNFSYGKRKTWIVVSQIATNIAVIACAFFTDLSQAQVFASISFFMYFALSMQDTSLDALCLKQLQDPRLMSTIQAACQSSGSIIGGLTLLKVTSLEFANKIGFHQPIANLSTVLLCLSLFLLIPTLIIHFRFQQTSVEAETRARGESVCKVYSIYRYFIKKEYRYCRTVIFLLIYNQGFNFFSAGYNYQLIKAGFSRDTMNTIDNIQNIILTAFVFIFGVKANALGFKKSYAITITLSLLISLYLEIFFPTNLLPIIITNAALGILNQWDFLLTTALCANFPETGATGMLYTMNASGANFGKNLFIHQAILKKLPWKPVSLAGLAFQLPVMLFFMPKMMDLIEEGETKIQILEHHEDQNQQKVQNDKEQNNGAK